MCASKRLFHTEYEFQEKKEIWEGGGSTPFLKPQIGSVAAENSSQFCLKTSNKNSSKIDANKTQINQQKLILLQNSILYHTKHFLINQTPQKRIPSLNYFPVCIYYLKITYYYLKINIVFFEYLHSLSVSKCIINLG